MSKVSNEQIKKIASLARIHVSDEDAAELSAKMTEIVSWVESLNEIDTENVEPMMAVENSLQMRDDEVKDDNISEEVLKNAPESKLGFFAVPKFVE